MTRRHFLKTFVAVTAIALIPSPISEMAPVTLHHGSTITTTGLGGFRVGDTLLMNGKSYKIAEISSTKIKMARIVRAKCAS